ncbi:MAG: P-loop NTPase [Candidatus Aenigmarchaeota archaeon]|nr:P-loop NTPase [Candidatus Aenigmarchaeota archaeon]
MYPRVIGVISGKGGVGKTTTVLNLSAALNEMNKNVVAIDADVKMSGLALQLGMYYFPVTLNDVLKDIEDLYRAVYIHSSGLRVIPASICLEDCNISNLKKILNHTSMQNNMIIVDGPPGLEKNALSVMESCKRILVVTEPELPAITDVMKIVNLCREREVKLIGVVINKYRKGREQITKEEIESTLQVPIIGVIPEDKNVKKSVFRKKPIVLAKPYSPASVAYKKIAARLVGEKYEEENIIKRLVGRF